MPHGGGGPGIGPIGVAEHLVPFLPGHLSLDNEEGAVASAAWGSASIAAICWMYLSMMGPDGLKEATEVAILNANYIAKKLGGLFPVLYSGNKGLVAHECILDPRRLTHDAGLTVDDIAKRLMDYGFHGPHHVLPRARHLDGGTHRIGTQGRTGPLHSSHGAYSCGNHGRYQRRSGQGRQRS